MPDNGMEDHKQMEEHGPIPRILRPVSWRTWQACRVQPALLRSTDPVGRCPRWAPDEDVIR